MNSATSTDPGLRPWQLFLLAGMLAATAVVLVSTGRTMSSIIVLSLTVVAASLVAVAAYRSLVAARSPRTCRCRTRRAEGARAPGPRAREGAGAALDQGARVRPRDAQDGRRRFRGDARPAQAPRRGPDPAARRQRLPRRPSNATWPQRGAARRPAVRRGAGGGAGRGRHRLRELSAPQRRRRPLLQDSAARRWPDRPDMRTPTPSRRCWRWRASLGVAAAAPPPRWRCRMPPRCRACRCRRPSCPMPP